jgi:hypothetical protein
MECCRAVAENSDMMQIAFCLLTLLFSMGNPAGQLMWSDDKK